MIVGFTGTIEGMSERQLTALRVHLMAVEPNSEFHHGDCLGADEEAHEIAHELGFLIVIHPPLNKSKRAFCTRAFQVLKPKQYLERNHDIVDACQVLFAAPKTDEEELRSGTWATVRYARKMNKQRLILSR
jgi:hypothetical protein